MVCAQLVDCFFLRSYLPRSLPDIRHLPRTNLSSSSDLPLPSYTNTTMDDYEHANALEWDLNKGGGRRQVPSEDSWEVVDRSKKQQKPVVRLPPAQAQSVHKNHFQQVTRPSHNHSLKTTPQASIGSRYEALLPQIEEQQSKQTFADRVPQTPQGRFRRDEPNREPFQVSKPSKGKQKQNESSANHRSGLSKKPFPQAYTQQHQQRRSPTKWPKQEARPQNARQRRPPPKMTTGSDNLGDLQFRNHETAKTHIRIPVDLADKDKGHEMIAKYYGTYIMYDSKQTGNTSTEFGIWGDPKAIAKTIEDIRAWIEDWQSSQKSSRSRKFAKVCSLTPDSRIRAEKRWEKEVKKHRFRQFPPLDKAFDAIGSFHWPVKEYKPNEILGSSYEALDPIRMDCKCYVVFDEKQGLFHVMGKPDAVKTGLIRLRRTYFQIVAQTIAPVDLYVLRDAAEHCGKIILVEYERIRAVSGEATTEPRIAYSPCAVDIDFTIDISENVTSGQLIRSSFLTILNKLHFYRGNIQLRVHLGTFLAIQYMRTDDGVYTIDQYEAMIRESRFKGEVTQEYVYNACLFRRRDADYYYRLGNKVVEHAALHKLRDAVTFLTPQDHATTNLASIKPLYTAIFTFADPSNSELGDMRLAITWEEHQESNSATPTYYDRVSKKWTRLDRDTKGPTSILDISISEIHTGMAWQFGIDAAQAIDEARLPKDLADYGDSVKLDDKLVQGAANSAVDNMSFMNYRSSLTHLKALEQRITYRYNVVGSDYTLELSRFQHRTFPSRTSPMLSAAEPTLYEARWGLSVYRIAWDTMFTENERLPIGERAEWSHDEEMWFPNGDSDEGKQGGGFSLMMEKLKHIQGLVMDDGDEDLMGGMRVG